MTYKIKVDTNNFMIVKEGKKASGEDKEDVVGFYPTVKALYQGAANKMIKVEGLDNLVEVYKELDAMCQAAIKTVEAHEKEKKAAKKGDS